MLTKIFLVALMPCVLGFERKVHIGGLFRQDVMIQKAFKLSAQVVNKDRRRNDDLADIRLQTESIEISNDPYEVSQNVCRLLNLGVAAIFGPQEKITSEHVQSMCDTVEIPNIVAKWDSQQARCRGFVNLYPHAPTLAMLFYHLVKEYNWKRYTILYENSDGLIRMKQILNRWGPDGHSVTVRHLNGPNYRDVLRDVKKSGENNIVIDCSVDILPEVLKQAQQVGIMSETHSYIVSSLDLQTIDLTPYQYGGTNITGLRLIDPDDPVVQDTFSRKNLDWGLDDPSQLRVEAALMYDAVQLFARALKKLDDTTKPHVKRMSCNGSDSWKHGDSLTNSMRTSEFRGLTGLVKFDTAGFRSNFNVDIMDLNVKGLKRIGGWNSESGIEFNKTSVEQGLHNETFIVLIALTAPYAMLKESSATMSGNDRFEGFGVDIIQEIANILGFNYTFVVQTDNVYGSFNSKTEKWNGMIRKLIDGKAHLAITDLTITSEREKYIDFTMPFMNLGISILYKQPTRAPNLFSFLLPFSKEVWLYLMGAFVFVSLLLFIIGRICPAEWNNPYPCIEQPKELRNQLTLKNALWFTIGSIMQQGSEIAPIGISTRMMAGCWWFFCLIMVSSYTANLAAFLTIENVVSPINSVEDLANQKTIKYGAKRNGSTMEFFRDSNYSTYKKMWEYMERNAEDVLTSTNDKGLAKVINENYAFLMESTTIEYVSERKCNVIGVGGLLDAKGYGIAMQKNATYRNKLSTAVVKLQESGVLSKLKIKWWKQKRDGGKCQRKPHAGDASELGLDNVGGVFLVLVTGVALSCLYTAWELLWDVWCTSCKKNVSFTKEIGEELKFAVKCSGTSKPVRRNKGSSDRSEESNTRDRTPPYGYVPIVITAAHEDK